MVCATYKSIFAMMAAIALSSTNANVGVCHSPWNHPTVNEEVLKSDIKLITQFFSSFRTFETRMSGFNIIQIAGSVGAKVAAGVQMNDLTAVDAEIEAVCAGYLSNPDALEAVWVGNENLQNDAFGNVSVDDLIGFINRVKECTGGNVPVGTVQRINEWLSADGADRLHAACDKAGTNIYPYFTEGKMTPIEKLDAQWQQIVTKFGADKFQLTETGWPTAGESSFGNTPSLETAQQYLNDFAKWSEGMDRSYWFMLFDATTSYTGAEYEKHFGVFSSDGTPKLTIPSTFGGDSGVPTNTSDIPVATMIPVNEVGIPLSRTPEATTQEPTTEVDVPETPSAYGTPPTEPTTEVDVPLSWSPEAPTAESPDQESPVQEPITEVGVPLSWSPEAQVDVPEAPAAESPEQESPAYTPTMVQSGKDCAM